MTYTTEELKAKILSLSFGGVMYDITEGSELNMLVRNHDKTAIELADSITDSDNGIDKGVRGYIREVLA